MKLGIVGLPNVGKSTLFNALTSTKGADAANYPFCTIEPNQGVVEVPDERLSVLSKMYNSQKIIPATIEFLDIAGLVKGASNGEGLGNKFLANIRESDAIIHVVRCFEIDDIVHVEGSVNPIRDLETIDTELILSDIEIMTRKIDRVSKALKGDNSLKDELEFCKAMLEKLNNQEKIDVDKLSDEEKEWLSTVALLSTKPVIIAANLAEDDFVNGIENNEHYKNLLNYAKEHNLHVIPISAEIESQLTDLDDEERNLYLADLGLSESTLNRLIKESYNLLGLISYITSGEKETRAWTIVNGTKAPQAAGKIHTDFERCFIRAEVVSYDELVSLGSMNAAKEAGKVRSEGKDYVMKDGDVVLFRVNA